MGLPLSATHRHDIMLITTNLDRLTGPAALPAVLLLILLDRRRRAPRVRLLIGGGGKLDGSVARGRDLVDVGGSDEGDGVLVRVCEDVVVEAGALGLALEEADVVAVGFGHLHVQRHDEAEVLDFGGLAEVFLGLEAGEHGEEDAAGELDCGVESLAIVDPVETIGLAQL
jgi:hypothetical protein